MSCQICYKRNALKLCFIDLLEDRNALKDNFIKSASSRVHYIAEFKIQTDYSA